MYVKTFHNSQKIWLPVIFRKIFSVSFKVITLFLYLADDIQKYVPLSFVVTCYLSIVIFRYEDVTSITEPVATARRSNFSSCHTTPDFSLIDTIFVLDLRNWIAKILANSLSLMRHLILISVVPNLIKVFGTWMDIMATNAEIYSNMFLFQIFCFHYLFRNIYISSKIYSHISECNKDNLR